MKMKGNKALNIYPVDSSDEEESIVFVVAVMGYTLRANSSEHYEDNEKAFLKLIKSDNGRNDYSDYYVSKKYFDIIDDANVSLSLLSDMDPSQVYECSRPNGISLRSDACILFYDPTRYDCLDNLDKHCYSLLYYRQRHNSSAPIMCFIGINGDKPEQHKFNRTQILSAINKHYKEDTISLYSICLNSTPQASENAEIIIKNLAIACLDNYQKTTLELSPLTTVQIKLKPLSLPTRWKTPYSFYAALREANEKSQQIREVYLPQEIIRYMTILFFEILFQEGENPKLQFDIYKEMFMEETAHLSEKLRLTNYSKQIMDKPENVSMTQKKESVTCDKTPRRIKQNCSIM